MEQVELTPLVEIAGGSFSMGSADFYPDEGPPREVTVERFAIDRHPVTNRQFAAFVDETAYRTVAEQPLDPGQYPGADPAVLVPGGLVFTPTRGPVPLDRWDQWWRWQPSASWREPGGPGTSVAGREDHPVVLVAYDDAMAYAAWAGRDLPTEAEFEFAAAAGRSGSTYAWGDDLHPGDQLMANTWQGHFPHHNTGANGFVGTSPVGSFPANGFGLHDLIGNVWEWTKTYYAVGEGRAAAEALDAVAGLDATDGLDPTDALSGPVPTPSAPVSACCAPQVSDLVLADEDAVARSATPAGEFHPRRVVKGGSHLCAPEYCLRYRPAARSAQSVDSATTHVGFRCVSRD